MSAYDNLKQSLAVSPKSWLVTGVAGFIGSHLLETLLLLGQRVVGLDNFSAGKKANLEDVAASVGTERWRRFQLIEGDIENPAVCRQACNGVDLVLHQAALGSVSRSMEDPLQCHQSNVTGFLNMLVAAREAKVKRLVYASSCAIYGDDPTLPKLESHAPSPISPYAATKVIDEMYAVAFARAYGFDSIGLRYFNVFGPRQDPDGAYAAVIPKWIEALVKRQPILINGDGETSRDFCYVADVVQANLLAAAAADAGAINQTYNIALGQRTTLNELFSMLQNSLRGLESSMPIQKPVYRDFRAGDVRHSVADISKGRRLLGFDPSHQVESGLGLAMAWYRARIR